MTSSGLMRNVYRRVLNASSAILGVERTKRLDSCIRFGRKLDLKNPRTLSDKIVWIELNTDQALAARCTDKYAVRSYVEEKGLGSILIPLVGGPWAKASDIDVDGLPNQFVLKATHGCEMNYICRDKTKLDYNDLMEKTTLWLKQDYSRACIEPHYKLVSHRLYAEEFIGGLGDVVDYKIHCINGEPSFVLTCSNRENSLKLNLYDLDWNPIRGLQGPMKSNNEMSRPGKLAEMIEISRTLASDFEFVRVDLYEENDRVLFGELTFSPACGVLEYFTDSFVEKWGEVLHVKGLD
ncbi:ATP-grasp fold amidoligase family protein [Parolsenella catena]|uniref:ATP-grasp fold amidoligase family protein n=1 Tax=Parolsenella catena TaxID=2003188 RepID=UPI003F9890DC